MELIDLDALRKAFHERIWHFDKSSWDEANAIIDNVPTIIKCGKTLDGLPLMDLRPKPHGKWIMVTEPDGFTHSKCSNCNQFNDWGDVPFCPWCGSDNKGGGE